MKLAAAVGVVVLLGPLAAAQDPPEPDTEPPRQAVIILRAVNTVEGRMGGPRGGYGSLAQVLASPFFKEQFKDAAAVDSATATVAARSLVLLLSEDRKHYHAQVASREKCAVVMFTNESGLLYAGRALGCDTQD
jgi:hypothetical protein